MFFKLTPLVVTLINTAIIAKIISCVVDIGGGESDNTAAIAGGVVAVVVIIIVVVVVVVVVLRLRRSSSSRFYTTLLSMLLSIFWFNKIKYFVLAGLLHYNTIRYDKT